MKNLTNLWGDMLKNLRNRYPSDFDMWLAHLHFVNFDSKKKILKLAVSHVMVQEGILSRFKTQIEDLFSELSGINEISLDIIVSDEENLFTIEKELEKKEEPVKPEKEKKVHRLVSPKTYLVDINSRYTFNRFVVGSNNKLAHAAAVQVSQNPGQEYSPFFIYGGVGLGKTHLMQAIGNYILKNKPELHVIYLTVENYMNDYVIALKNRRMEAFQAKYRKADVLLLDDVQFLEEKEGFQEELFHTFNKLYQNNKQIVFTCDKPPKELKNIQERLVTRLSWGLTIDIKHPDLETRKAIILKKLEENRIAGKVEIPIVDFLAENITTNIRDIESAVLKIHSLIKLANEKITIELLENNLADILTSIRVQKKQITSEIIKKAVANHYQISYTDLISTKRTKEVSFPRQMAMFLSKELLKSSYADIGNEFGGRDHSTVLASYKKIEKEIKKNPSIRNDYEELLKIFSNF